jgi:AcrR family transcriptional regulator
VAWGTAREAQREATRLRILESARRLLADNGLLEVPIDKVAAEAGVSKATVFFHFGSRVGLISALAAHLYSRVAITIESGDDLPGFIARMIEAQRTDDAHLLWQLGDLLAGEHAEGPDSVYQHVFALVRSLMTGRGAEARARIVTPAAMMVARRVAQGLATDEEVNAFVKALRQFAEPQ